MLHVRVVSPAALTGQLARAFALTAITSSG
jgi:hypothetical protein